MGSLTRPIDETTINIFIAEDDEDDYDFLEKALEIQPYNCQIKRFVDGVELVEQLKQPGVELPDMIFLDLRLPRVDGSQCLEEIKQKRFLKEIPVIIYSGTYLHEIAEYLYQRGAYFYIKKPLTLGALKTAINKILNWFEENGKHVPTRNDFVLNPS